MVLAVAAGAPALAPNPPDAQFRDHLYAPPMQVRVVDAAGRLRAPFVYPVSVWSIVSSFDTTKTGPPRCRCSGRREASSCGFLMRPVHCCCSEGIGSGATCCPRLVLGARTSLGVALVAAMGTIVLGALLGAAAGGWRGMA